MWLRPRSMPAGNAATSSMRDDARDDGAALVLVLTATVLVSSIGVSLLLLTDLEVAGAGNHRDAAAVAHAADAALDYAIHEMAAVPDWSAVLTGTISAGLDGPDLMPAGGVPVDVAGLTDSLQQSTEAGGGWGANTPRWRVFAHGPLAAVTGGVVPDTVHAVVWVADDVAEEDGDPEADGNGAVMLRARVAGVRGSGAVARAVIARTAVGGVVRRVSWGPGP